MPSCGIKCECDLLGMGLTSCPHQDILMFNTWLWNMLGQPEEKMKTEELAILALRCAAEKQQICSRAANMLSYEAPFAIKLLEEVIYDANVKLGDKLIVAAEAIVKEADKRSH